MKEELKTLVLGSRDELLVKLQESGHAFAAWKMPHEKTYQFIISLSNASQVAPNLTDLDKGFVVNRFSDNHPANPYFISADIVIKEDEVVIDPRINDAKIDALVQHLSAASVPNVARISDELSIAPTNDFGHKVEQAVERIKTGEFEKVVLSRYKDMELPKEVSLWSFFQDISKSYQNSFCSLSHIPGKGLWIGATPELLLSDSHEHFKTIALAGTKILEPEQHLSEIAWTQKEIEEQALVSRYIINCFKKLRLREFHEHGPKTVQAGHLAHLKTEFEVKYNELSFENLGDQMLELLHPTSAVCGMPIEVTQPWIHEIEGYDREFYAGFLGPVGFNNEVSLFVNLRCIKIDSNIIRFYAGAGITEDSVPSREYEETEMKMNVLMSKLHQH